MLSVIDIMLTPWTSLVSLNLKMVLMLTAIAEG